MGREVEDSRGLVLVEGADPAGAQPVGGGEEEDVFDCCCHILDHIEAGPAAAVGRDALGVGADDDIVGCLGEGVLVARCGGEALFDFGVVDDNEVSGLEVAGGWGEVGLVDEAEDDVAGDGLVCVGADAVAFGDGVGEFHGCMVRSGVVYVACGKSN